MEIHNFIPVSKYFNLKGSQSQLKMLANGHESFETNEFEIIIYIILYKTREKPDLLTTLTNHVNDKFNSCLKGPNQA